MLCEKPLAPSVAAAERMLAAARAADRRLMMGSKFRFTPDVTAARKLLDRGVCGEPVIYENVFCSHVDMSDRWNARPDVSGGGVLIDNGCHSVDLARYLLGPLARVQVQFGRKVQDLPVEDTARMLFQSHGGALGSIDLSWSVHKETDAYVRLHGTEGTLEIGWRGSRYKTEGRHMAELRRRLRQGHRVPQPARELLRRRARPGLAGDRRPRCARLRRGDRPRLPVRPRRTLAVPS